MLLHHRAVQRNVQQPDPDQEGHHQEVAAPQVPPAKEESLDLLRRRLETVRSHRERTVVELGEAAAGTAADHILLLVDAEVEWLERAIARLGAQS